MLPRVTPRSYIPVRLLGGQEKMEMEPNIWNQFVGRLAERDDDTCNAVVDQFAQRLIRLVDTRLSRSLAQRVDPEDVVQSVFRSFFRRTHEFSLQRSGDLWRLLAAMAVNKTRKQAAKHRAEKRDFRREESLTDSAQISNLFFDREPTPNDVVAFEDALEHALATLSPLQQRAFQMRLEGDSLAKIALELNKSQRTVRRTLQSIREQLTDYLLDRNHDD